MRTLSLLLTTLALSSPVLVRALDRRNIVAESDIADTYDFVICGGGTAGLVLAARLSEDSNHTVLVLEAGDSGDAVAAHINIPADAYYSSLTGSTYDWAYPLVAQSNADDRVLSWARGKVLGGSSAINGMYLVRPSELEVDTWAALVDGGDRWAWANTLAAIQKSETFTAPSDDERDAAHIAYDSASRGTSGPVHASYPGYILPTVDSWTTTLAAVGVPSTTNPDDGSTSGAFIATSAINPTNWTRSYARSAYIDPLPPRSNLDILPNATVTRIIFSSNSTNTAPSANNLTASGVEFAASSTAARRTITVRKEVILSGGAIGSPQILMLSGVGPTDVLEAAGVTVQVALPGVGQHLQDHISAEVVWNTTAETALTLYASNASSIAAGTSTPYLSFINSATAYVNATALLGADAAATLQASIADSLAASAAAAPSQYSEVIAGFEAIYNATASLFATNVGQVEILLSLTGSTSGEQTVAVQAALQHPYSQGRLYINSSDPFVYPLIDPNYLSHAADLTILREGLKFARTLGATAPLSTAMGTEVSPGSAVSTDDEWDAWIKSVIWTEFHPSCSCAMLPEAQGGVVDADLRVYGLANVRVIDASVYPIEFSAHLQAQTYGLAEQAATLIRDLYNGVSTATSTSASSSTASGAGSASSASASSTGSQQTTANGAAASGPVTAAAAVAAAALGALLVL